MDMDTRPHIDPGTWNRLIAKFPEAHILQTGEWGEIKSRHGWEPIYCVWVEKGNELCLVHEIPAQDVTIEAAALILRRRIGVKALGFSVLYSPKGPLLVDWQNEKLCSHVFNDLKELARREKAILIKIDPDVRLGTGIPGTDDERDDLVGLEVSQFLEREGWLFSHEQIQFRHTVLIELNQPEEALLARMKQKTRYNLRLAARKGVEIRVGTTNDLDDLFQMYAETAVRDGFVLREPGYYLDVWRTFLNAGMAEPLIALVEGKAVAAVVIFRFAGKAWYLYGMSRMAHREKMPNYLLQWEAMRRAKASGCRLYDFWGAPDRFDENDPMWGVYKFKDGFGGVVTRFIGAWDYPTNKPLYRLYTQVMPGVLSLMRRRGFTRLQQSINQ